MSEPTPGPWAVNPISARVDAFDSGVPVPVCELLWPTDERTEDQTVANGLLIAAAPELLDAAIRVVRFYDAHGGPMADLRAAIAKAEGVSHV